jgi:hypothetical protein
LLKGGIIMAKKSTKKTAEVEEVVEETKEEVTVVSEELVARRGKTITLRTYSDGKVEEI